MEPIKRIARKIKKHSPLIKRFAPLTLIAIVLVVTFVTCGRREEQQPMEPEQAAVEESPSAHPPIVTETEPVQVPEPDPDPEPEPDPEPDPPGPINPLTGQRVETDVVNIRPLAIMINNNVAAMPQLGVSKADIIYEVLVEGGITRMLALYQDISDVDVIGSIRSARTYFVDIAQSYDAIYIFAGGSPGAYAALSNRDITRLDGVSGRADIFYRDQLRRTSLGNEHSLVTTGELIMLWLPTYDFRLELEEDYERALSFAEDGNPMEGAEATELSVSFSLSKVTTFLYDADEGLYFLSQHGDEYRDGNDDTQISATNILILRTNVSRIPGDSEGRLDISTTGSGAGYFVCEGKYVDIEWSRDDNTSQFAYMLEDGTELELRRGRTYICIIPNDNEVNFG